MIFSFSNEGMKRSLDIGADSVNLTAKDLVHEVTIGSQESVLVASRLLMFQRQDFLSNHLARVPVNSYQEGTMELKDEVLSSVGSRNMNTSGYQVSDLDDVEFYWENDWLDVDSVFKTGLGTPFSRTALVDMETTGSAENSNPFDEQEDKENSPPPTTPISEKNNVTPCIAENSSIWKKNRKISCLC